MAGKDITSLIALVMGPKGNDFDSLLLFKNLINKPVLSVDSARVKAIQITCQFFIIWRNLIWVVADDVD